MYNDFLSTHAMLVASLEAALDDASANFDDEDYKTTDLHLQRAEEWASDILKQIKNTRQQIKSHIE